MNANSQVVLTEMVFPNQTNHYGTLFGGEALKLMDKAAFIIASRACRMAVVTASLDRTDFRFPVYHGELVEIRGRVLSRGRTSLRVEIELFSENTLTAERRLCSIGNFVMVAIDANGRPAQIPPELATG